MADYCLEEEVDLLSSYFCLNGESCHVISKNLISITMKLLVNDTQGITLEDTNLDSTLSLSFELPPEYPLVNPNVSVQCSHLGFTRNLASSISDMLNDEARTLIGMFIYKLWYLLKISGIILSYPLADCFKLRAYLASRCLCSNS